MKKLTLIQAALMLCAAGAYAQGTIQYVNSVATAVTQQGAGVPAGYKVEILYQVDNGGAAPAALTYANYSTAISGWSLAGVTSVFNTPASIQGVFSGTTQTLNGVAAGANAWLEIVAWNGGASTLAAAVTTGTGTSATFFGNSTVWAEQTGNPGGSPAVPTPSITGAGQFAGISTQPVPEPTTIALGGLGAASLLLFRRRK
jgi:hypothetical protein